MCRSYLNHLTVLSVPDASIEFCRCESFQDVYHCNYKKAGNVHINITLRRVRETTVAVETQKKYYIF
jgi:hypothetical protein